MAYENDGYMGYVLTATYPGSAAYPGGTMAPGGMIFGDREQVQARADCLNAKAKSLGDGSRYGVAGIVPIADVPISAEYTGPFHASDDDCQFE